MNIAVFDLETNGMAGTSVVSASSIIFNAEGAILDVFNRFYLPVEQLNPYATRIHGLTIDRLVTLRKHIQSTPYFAEDWPDLLDFWESRNVAGVVVHNLSFDAAFLPEIAQGAVRWWCSMKGLTSWCAIPKRGIRAGRQFKWPKLGEAADIVCNGPEALTPPNATTLVENAIRESMSHFSHVSLFDCFELYRIVSRIRLHRRDLIKFEPFVIPFYPPTARFNTVSKTIFTVDSGANESGRANKANRDLFISDVLACDRKIRAMANA